MAEARSAVRLVPATVQRFEVDINTSVRSPQLCISDAGFVLYIPPLRDLWRCLRGRLYQRWRRFRHVFLPMPITGAFIFISGFSIAAMTTKKGECMASKLRGFSRCCILPLGRVLEKIFGSRIKNLAHKKVSLEKYPTLRTGVSAAVYSTTGLYAWAVCMRVLIRQLFSYTGWVKEVRNPTWRSKLWAVFVRPLVFGRAKLLTYQNYLPALPVPPLGRTVQKYLDSMEGWLDADEFTELKESALSFLAKEGPYLQKWLYVKWLLSPNYVSDWWLKYVYLRPRAPIAINSNWFGLDYCTPSTLQGTTGALCVFISGIMAERIESGNLEPLLLNNMVPLCMDQYKYAFSTTRVPALEQDALVKYDGHVSRHAAVLHKGRFFKLPMFCPKTGRRFSVAELEAGFDSILNDESPADADEQLIPALTCVDRGKWASVREVEFMHNPINRAALNVIESGVIFVSLDDPPAITDISLHGKHLLAGNGRNRWCDKSICMCVCSDGELGALMEHSFGDAPVVSHLIELIRIYRHNIFKFHPDGRFVRSPQDEALLQKQGSLQVPVERLAFHMTPGLRSAVQTCYEEYKKEVDDVHLHVEEFNDYGKGFVKKMKCSPDGWLQIAMQLAFYRDQKKFVQTYESCMTRLFLHGRTETIRSASKPSCAFVRAMENPSVSATEQLDLLRKACDHHADISKDALIGKGVDRHLLALYVLPMHQASRDLYPDVIYNGKSSLGGFGPVTDEGYGVFYMIAHEDTLFFTISSKKSCSGTDSVRFGKGIAKALRDMQKLSSAKA